MSQNFARKTQRKRDRDARKVRRREDRQRTLTREAERLAARQADDAYLASLSAEDLAAERQRRLERIISMRRMAASCLGMALAHSVR